MIQIAIIDLSPEATVVPVRRGTIMDIMAQIEQDVKKLNTDLKQFYTKACECDVLEMRLGSFDHLRDKAYCLNCGCWASFKKVNGYNAFWGYSGYDEYPDGDLVTEDEI